MFPLRSDAQELSSNDPHHGDRSHYYTFRKRNEGARYLVGWGCGTHTWEDEALVKEILLLNEYWREGGAASPVHYDGENEEDCVRRYSCVIDDSESGSEDEGLEGDIWAATQVKDIYSECGVISASSDAEE